MNKNEFNKCLRDHVDANLAPSQKERAFVSQVYESVQAVVGTSKSIQIGSFARKTAITPLHDLDVLYVLTEWDPDRHDPSGALADLEKRLLEGYKNPTEFEIEIGRQTHSVTISFRDGEKEVFGVDVVPAYILGRNEFGEDTYVVPEIAQVPRANRRLILEAAASGLKEMGWIATDPRGYTTVARQISQNNNDFRKAVRFAKGWRSAQKAVNGTFPMKSFHIEQAITEWVRAHPNVEIFDIVFEFFRRVPDFMRYPQFPDRADLEKKIDAYVEGLSEAEVREVIQARDGLLIALENFEAGRDVQDILAADPRRRASVAEEYLFDKGIPVLSESSFSILAEVQARKGGFQAFILNAIGRIQTDRQIRFTLGPNAPQADMFKWKVKNDDGSEQPRGEITDHKTLNDLEKTKYAGSHYVECFAIKDGRCIGRGRQDVVLDPYGRVTGVG